MDYVDRRERLELVMREVVEPVRRYLARRTDAATADDVLSETMVVLWRRIDEVPAEAVPWAIGVARLQLANARRSATRQTRLSARIAVVDPPGHVPDHADSDTDYIRDAIARLRPGEAEVVRMWAWDELTLEQIAAALGVSVNAVTIRLHRARKKLRQELGKADPVSGHTRVKEGENA